MVPCAWRLADAYPVGPPRSFPSGSIQVADAESVLAVTSVTLKLETEALPRAFSLTHSSAATKAPSAKCRQRPCLNRLPLLGSN